jgi:hypothetical protein
MMFRKTNNAAGANRPPELLAGDRFKAETADHHISANADGVRAHKGPPTSGNQAATNNKTAEQKTRTALLVRPAEPGLGNPVRL